MREVARVMPWMPAQPARSRVPGRARATAAVLPHAAFAPVAEADSFSDAPRPVIDRLAWPVAAAAILAVCAGLWLGVGSLLRLILA
jgi:hypothetical protein